METEMTAPEQENCKIVYVYKLYPSQIEAYKRYREKNLDTIKAQQREYCKNRYNTDPEYRARKLEQAKNRRELLKKQKINEISNITEK